MAKRMLVIVLMILMTSLMYIVALPRGYAADPVRFYIDPPKVEDQALVPNTTFNVSIKLDNIPTDPGLAGIELNVTWDSTILNGVAMQEIIFHEVTPEAEQGNIWKLKHVIAPNSVSYAYTFQDIDAAIAGGYAPISGSHTVANITLKVVGTGKCDIYFVTHKLGDPNALPIDHEIGNGSFSNVGAPPPPAPALLYVDPAKIVNSSLGSGSSFNVNVNIINASGLASLEFKLGFNATALNAQSVASGGFIPSSATPITLIDNTTGFAKFNVSLATPLNGDGTVAVIQFLVLAENVNNSTLHIYDVALVDSSNQALPFTTADGSFTNMKTLLGDVDHNGQVDIFDAILASKSFGSTSSGPNWNPEADINGDGEVDVFDIVLLGQNFGRKI